MLALEAEMELVGPDGRRNSRISVRIQGLDGISLQIEPGAPARQGHGVFGGLNQLRPVTLHGKPLELLPHLRCRRRQQFEAGRIAA